MGQARSAPVLLIGAGSCGDGMPGARRTARSVLAVAVIGDTLRRGLPACGCRPFPSAAVPAPPARRRDRGDDLPAPRCGPAVGAAAAAVRARQGRRQSGAVPVDDLPGAGPPRPGARPAGPPPAGPAPGSLAATSCVEAQRLVNAAGIITLGNQVIQAGSPLAGQRARIRLDGQVMHVTQDGILWRGLPCPIPPGQRHKLQGGLRHPAATSPAVTAFAQQRDGQTSGQGDLSCWHRTEPG